MTNDQMEQFNIIGKKFIDGSITMEEAILQLRGGGLFTDISYLVLFIWLWKLQNSQVGSFQPIRPPHQEWMPKGAHQLLKIGNRRSNNYSRIYEGKDFLKYKKEFNNYYQLKK